MTSGPDSCQRAQRRNVCTSRCSPISQTVMQEFFTMTMLTDLTEATVPFDEVRQALSDEGERLGLSIRIQNEDIFNAMHRI